MSECVSVRLLFVYMCVCIVLPLHAALQVEKRAHCDSQTRNIKSRLFIYAKKTRQCISLIALLTSTHSISFDSFNLEYDGRFYLTPRNKYSRLISNQNISFRLLAYFYGNMGKSRVKMNMVNEYHLNGIKLD